MRSAVGLVLGAVSVIACRPSATPDTLDLTQYRVVDLSHSFGPRTLYWPTATSRFDLDTLSRGMTPGGYFYSANALATPEHGGTHLDAPIHFFQSGRSTDQIPVEQLIAPAIVIDITSQVAQHTDYLLTAEDVLAWERANDSIPRGAIVLLRTGYSRHWPNARAYLGDDRPGDASNLHFPSFGPDAARLLVEQRGVGALGADVASIDHGPSKDFQVHRIAAAANVVGLENLTNLDQLPPTGAIVIALPMKIEGGSGGPLRAIGLVRR
ncbi:MAG TPA: cyclase family protein [Gemmatimonadaceae bacterium]|nr:cyclase family protein [Gemmatimonadaceae bacterium]